MTGWTFRHSGRSLIDSNDSDYRVSIHQYKTGRTMRGRNVELMRPDYGVTMTYA